jgi:hypothetical protein
MPAGTSPQDTLLARLRETKGLAGQPEPAVTRSLFGVLVASVVRTLFLR